MNHTYYFVESKEFELDSLFEVETLSRIYFFY